MWSGVDYLNGTIIYPPNTGAYYQCNYCGNCTPPNTAVTITQKQYATISYVFWNFTIPGGFWNGSTSTSWVGSVPNGWFIYAGDWFSSMFFKIGAVINIISYFLTPINLNILGYTLSNINGLVLMTIIAIYILAYIPVIMVGYKAISPFSSLGG